MKPRILLVEDEEHLARGLRFNLEAEGWTVEVFDAAEPAEVRLADKTAARADLLVLDVGLPGMSGLDLLRGIRAAGDEVPVLMLTARDAEHEIVEGLDAGADDYLTKPFSLAVLLARVRRLLRRTPREGDAGAVTPAFTIGDATIHPDRFEIERDGAVRPLTAKELGLLVLLHERRGAAVSRGDILREVWELDPTTKTRVVDTFMLRLRKLIEPDPARPRHLLSVRAYGYRLADD